CSALCSPPRFRRRRRRGGDRLRLLGPKSSAKRDPSGTAPTRTHKSTRNSVDGTHRQVRSFRTIGRTTNQLTRTPLPQANAHAMIGRRARAAGIKTKVGTPKKGGTLETAAAMANHASTRSSQLYDPRVDDASLDEVERI